MRASALPRAIALAWTLVLLCALGVEAAPTVDAALGDHDATIYFDPAYDSSMASPTSVRVVAGDVTGDGAVDLVFGSPYADTSTGTDSGAVWVVYGPIEDGSMDLALATPDTVIVGARAGDEFGVMPVVGDFNGDRVMDIAVVAHKAGGARGACASCRRLYLFFGGALPARWDLAVTPADVVIYPYTILGGPTAVVFQPGWPSTSDIDRDGLTDLIIQGGWGPGSGLLYGRRTWPREIELEVTPYDTELRGVVSVSGLVTAGLAGDVNGDGNPDLAWGNPAAPSRGLTWSGEIAVWLGGGGRFPAVIDRAIDIPDVIVEGPAADAWIGEVFNLADFDGDSVMDIVTASKWQTPSGEWRRDLYFARGRSSWPATLDLATTADARVRAEEGTTTASFGSTLSVGDFDGDGIGDVVTGDVSGPTARASAGEAYLMRGHAGFGGLMDLDVFPGLLKLHGSEYADRMGRTGIHLADVDGDARDDMITIAPGSTGPDSVYAPDFVGETLLLRGCAWETCCDLWRDASLTTRTPPEGWRPAILPLDGEDCHRWRHESGAADLELDIVGDASRPLVFYTTPRTINGLRLTKGASGELRIRY